MIRTRLAAPLLITAAFLIGSTASAQIVTSLVEGNNGGVLSSDPQGPSASSVSSSLTFTGPFTVDFSQDGFGRAAQNPDGSGAVLVDAVFPNGQTGNYVEAHTTWTQTATNDTAAPVNYVFDFLITPASLRIGDFAGLEETDPQRPDVFFSAVIRVDGVPAFEATAHLIGGFVSHILTETGTSLGPVFTGGGTVFGYDFQSYANTLSLGSVAPGASITVEYEMIARVDTPGYEAGGRASIGDPFDLSGSPGFTGSLMPDGVIATEQRSWGQVKSLYE